MASYVQQDREFVSESIAVLGGLPDIARVTLTGADHRGYVCVQDGTVSLNAGLVRRRVRIKGGWEPPPPCAHENSGVFPPLVSFNY